MEFTHCLLYKKARWLRRHIGMSAYEVVIIYIELLNSGVDGNNLLSYLISLLLLDTYRIF